MREFQNFKIHSPKLIFFFKKILGFLLDLKEKCINYNNKL